MHKLLTNKDRCDPKNEVAFYPLFKKLRTKDERNGYCFNRIREDEWRVKYWNFGRTDPNAFKSAVNVLG